MSEKVKMKVKMSEQVKMEVKMNANEWKLLHPNK